jgi:hypothetical protein
MLGRPELARLGMKCRTLHIPMADRPDLGLPTRDLRVVGRRAALGPDPDDLADMIARILRLVALAVAVPDRDEERARAVEDQARAEMHGTVDRRHLLEDHLRALQRGAARVQPGAGDAGAVATGPRLREGQVDRPVLRETRIDDHVEQTALPARRDIGNTRDRRRQLAIRPDQPEPPRPLGDQHAPIRQEGQAPGILEPARHRLDGEIAGARRKALLRLRGRAKGQDGGYGRKADRVGMPAHHCLPIRRQP